MNASSQCGIWHFNLQTLNRSEVPIKYHKCILCHIIPINRLFFPHFSSSRHSNRGCWQDSSTIEDGDPRFKSKNRVRCGDLSIFSLGEDENSLTWGTSSAFFFEKCIIYVISQWTLASIHGWIALLWTCTDHSPKQIKQESTLMIPPLFISCLYTQINESDFKLYSKESIYQVVIWTYWS